MTRRPDPFDQQALEDALRSIGCPESCMSSTLSNYRLFVPLLFAQLGEEEIFRVLERARQDLGLREQESAWRSSIRCLAHWAEREIELYKQRRGQAVEQEPDLEAQLRLL